MIPTLIIIISCYTIVKLCDIVSKKETHPLVFWFAIIAVIIIGWSGGDIIYHQAKVQQEIEQFSQTLKFGSSKKVIKYKPFDKDLIKYKPSDWPAETPATQIEELENLKIILKEGWEEFPNNPWYKEEYSRVEKQIEVIKNQN